MRLFKLQRNVDCSGVSGIGVVAEGVQFADGECVIHWLGGKCNSLGIYPNIDDLVKIHGHDGATQVVWVTAEVSPLGS